MLQTKDATTITRLLQLIHKIQFVPTSDHSRLVPTIFQAVNRVYVSLSDRKDTVDGLRSFAELVLQLEHLELIKTERQRTVLGRLIDQYSSGMSVEDICNAIFG
jgi:hypothetical protein